MKRTTDNLITEMQSMTKQELVACIASYYLKIDTTVDSVVMFDHVRLHAAGLANDPEMLKRCIQ